MGASHLTRRFTAAAITAAAAVSAITAGGSGAGATGAVGGGFVFMHGPGSVYAGSGATVTSVTTASGTATYAVEVVNKGTQLAQYNVRLFPSGVGDVVTLKSGATDVTVPALAQRGYFTKLLAPGKTEILSLRDKLPATATQTDHFFGSISLRDTDGNFLNQMNYETNVRATTGPFANDVYTSTAGSAAVIAEPFLPSVTASEAVKPAGKATFTVKLKNDTQTATQLRVSFGGFPPCSDPGNASFPATVKAGSADITTAARAGTYMTPALAHGQSTTLTVTIGYPSPPPMDCATQQFSLVAFTGLNASEADLLAVLAAT